MWFQLLNEKILDLIEMFLIEDLNGIVMELKYISVVLSTIEWKKIE